MLDRTICGWQDTYTVIAHIIYSLSNSQQTLGVALPCAIATCMLRPEEKLFLFAGDGGFFSAMELETAVRHLCNFVHCVWRDGSYDMVGSQEQIKYGRRSGINFGEVDLVKFAKSFGATGRGTDTDIT